MEEFSNEKLFELLQGSGLEDLLFDSEGKSKNLFSLLKIEPKLDETGKRLLTPYEIIGTPPVFEGEVEVPIVFSIKNPVNKIGKFLGEKGTFIYKQKAQKKSRDILTELKHKYRENIMQGNMEEAANILEAINHLTGGRADEVLGGFYDYTKFYRQMKKQLLIDIFAHYFIMLMQKRVFKLGLIKSDKHYQAYHENKITLTGADINEISGIMGISGGLGQTKIKEVKIEFNQSYVNHKVKINARKISEKKDENNSAKVMSKEKKASEISNPSKQVNNVEPPAIEKKLLPFFNKRRIFEFNLFKHLRPKRKHEKLKEHEPFEEEKILEID